jgi:hypothetical protein
VYGVKGFQKVHWQLEGVSLDKFKREVRLWFNVHANDLESGAAISNGDPASATKQIKKSRFHFQKNKAKCFCVKLQDQLDAQFSISATTSSNVHTAFVFQPFRHVGLLAKREAPKFILLQDLAWQVHHDLVLVISAMQAA